jgi:glycine oxidase
MRSWERREGLPRSSLWALDPRRYNEPVKTADVIVVGAGVIGLAIARELRKRRFSVLVLERGEPGHEASWAAAGMLVGDGQENPPALREIASASASLYPEFVLEIEDESQTQVDLRSEGTLLFLPDQSTPVQGSSKWLTPAELAEIEPDIARPRQPVLRIEERSVDPRALTATLVKACLHRGVEIASGEQVTAINVCDSHVSGVSTRKTVYSADTVVNCAGAWSGQFPPENFPTRPVKGQMLAVVARRELLRHVLRSAEVYVVPRSDGRFLIGATIEEAGFDKRIVPETIRQMYSEAIKLVPALAEARILEDWAGLRPGTPDALPILGRTQTDGYFVATGHYRDGILLTPITAQIMAQVIMGESPSIDLRAFSPERFVQRDLRAG